ncbi:unnamed protein product [Caenorhabditis auriculariae]|uniref:Leishmanolysin-like peptidase n=1 Tax=Caenorhabditis auriculariae TaxID=2777116 RepID=A0A8S1HL17_9PELO|nr:unnamed protein product [Caenorhabditis auriculariae]
MSLALFFFFPCSAVAHFSPIDPSYFELPPYLPFVEKSSITATWEPIKFRVFYGKTVDSLSSAEQTFLKKGVQDTIRFYESFAKVNRDSVGLTLPYNCQKAICRKTVNCQKTVDLFPDDVKFVGCHPGQPRCTDKTVPVPMKNVDMVILVSIKSGDGTTVATCAPCSRAFDRRPSSALLTVYRESLKNYMSRKIFSRSGLYDTIVHEVAHALFFHADLYKDYVGYDQKHLISTTRHQAYPELVGKAPVVDLPIFEILKLMVQTRKVQTSNCGLLHTDEKIHGITFRNTLRAARNYYGCSSLKMVELENNGDPGSFMGHYESDFAPFETMRPDEMSMKMSFSNMSMALMEDSGWYQVDYSKHEFMAPLPGAKGCNTVGSCHLRQLEKKEAHSCFNDFNSHYARDNRKHSMAQCTTWRVFNCKDYGTNIKNYRCLPHVGSTTVNLHGSFVQDENGKAVSEMSYDVSGCFEVTCDRDHVVFKAQGKKYGCRKENEVITVRENYDRNNQWPAFGTTLLSSSFGTTYTVIRKIRCPDFCKVCESHPHCKTGRPLRARPLPPTESPPSDAEEAIGSIKDQVMSVFNSTNRLIFSSSLFSLVIFLITAV